MTEVRHLRGAPRSAELYARAVAGAVLPGPLWGGSTLPDQVLERWDVPIMPDAVSRYSQLTGFTDDGDGVPATYPSLLGFSLGLRLMTDRSFPLPALGMVHVADRITVHQPLRRGAVVRVAVSARDLRWHPKGAEVDLVTEVQAHGATVWSEVSTYLARGAHPPGLTPGEPPSSTIPDVPGTAATTTRIEVPGDLGRRFAAVSGDRNPIHLSGLTARAFGFRSAIAHGRWTMARSVAQVAGEQPADCSIDTKFRAPVPLPSTCDLVTETGPDGTDVWLTAAEGGALHVYTRIAPLR